MVKKIPRICIISFFTILCFYNLYYFQSFFDIFILIIMIFISLLFIILQIIKKNITPYLFIFVGILCACVSFFNLTLFSKPIFTLAKIKNISNITAILTSEPFPAGKKYYKATAKVIECNYKDGATFAATGNINLFLPKEMILQNNAYGISQYKGKNICKNFSKGLILKAEGKLRPKEKLIDISAFFVYKQIPEFIGWRSKLSRFRAFTRFNLMRLLSSWGNAGGLLLALLSANRDFLSNTCSVLFKKAGLAHILALSGMHVALIGLLAFQVGKIFRKKSSAINFSVLVIFIFVWFAGAAPSLNRALGMLIILVIGKYLGLKPKIISVLATMMLIHIIIKPIDALSLGFKLSYGALTGILTIGQDFNFLLKGKIPPKILGGISASIGAQLFTAPIIISTIGILAPIGIIASIMISPLVSLFLIFGIFAIFISMIFPSTNVIFSFLLNKLYNLILEITSLFAKFPALISTSTKNKFIYSIFAITISIGIIFYAKFLRDKNYGCPKRISI